MSLIPLGLMLALCAVFSPLVAAQQCAVCSNLEDCGNPINDVCTTVIVEFPNSGPGSCKFNPAPKCVPSGSCLFSVTVTIIDHGCGFLYSQKYCTGFVDVIGAPVPGDLACTPESFYFPNPCVVTDHPISCGRHEGWVFKRYFGQQQPEVIASPKGTCTACPGQVIQPEQGD
jgi:hypothetical protein